MSESHDSPQSPPSEELMNLSVQIGEGLCAKIDSHVQTLKFLGKSEIDKKQWIINAIKEQLDLERNKGVKKIHKKKYITVPLDKQLFDELEKRVEFIRKFTTSFSKKRWVVEALLAKLEKEEEQVMLLNQNVQTRRS